jgi:hypothetical protein
MGEPRNRLINHCARATLPALDRVHKANVEVLKLACAFEPGGGRMKTSQRLRWVL